MSKAFTRESDDVPDDIGLPQRPQLPPGAKNYMTADGARRLQAELEQLQQQERPEIARSNEPAVARQKLRLLDHRIHWLSESLQSAVIVEPTAGPADRVRFGATVIVRDRASRESAYRIVGIDETDIDQGWVSWLSPIAKALLNRRLGDRVKFRFPSGEEELEILRIA